MTGHQLDRLHGAMSILDSVPLARYGADIDFTRTAAVDAGRGSSSGHGRRALPGPSATPPQTNGGAASARRVTLGRVARARATHPIMHPMRPPAPRAACRRAAASPRSAAAVALSSELAHYMYMDFAIGVVRLYIRGLLRYA
jgi:hypothetical protein